MNLRIIHVAAFMAAANLCSVATAIVASYQFEASNLTGTQLAVDSSAQTSWTTSILLDNATGTGALGQGNQSGTNRTLSGDRLLLSSAREGDAQTPLAAGGNNESTWMSFTVTADSGTTFDFTDQDMIFNVSSGTLIGSGGVSADWSVYYSLDGGSSINLLSTQAGPSVPGSDGVSFNEADFGLTYDLTAVGSAVSNVEFYIDPVSTGRVNGSVGQRRVGIRDLQVNAIVVPEPSALGGLFGLAALLVARRRA